MKQKRLFSPSNILLAIVFLLFAVSLATVFTLNFRPLYYHDIEALNIPLMSGLPEAEIKLNYDALISYNSMFFTGELVFPTLPMSANGKIHFEEVKAIFVAVQVLLILSAVALVVGMALKLKSKNYSFLKLNAILAVAVPLLLGTIIAANWSFFFTKFHEIFFNNDYWIFSAETDPVITILPDTFFMHCAVLILAIVVLLSLLSLAIYLIIKNKSKKSLEERYE